jgi:pimeloyl-ACP methyl ester carboxylesterase
LKALGITIASAAVLAYLAVCLLVYQGGWQLMLHPSAKMEPPPASLPVEFVHFDAGETGTPRLMGWWIPADSPAPPTTTLLYLHGGDGSLANSSQRLELLRHANVNVFAVEYRGYGLSAGPHPTESRMLEDAQAALDYLTGMRHIPAATVVPYGEGLGAVFATELANSHPDLPAFILDTPDPNAFRRATSAGKARLLPMRLLVRERFDLQTALNASKAPKLLLADGPFSADAALTRENQAVFRAAPEPRMTVTFAGPNSSQAFLDTLHRFLDESAPQR